MKNEFVGDLVIDLPLGVQKVTQSAFNVIVLFQAEFDDFLPGAVIPKVEGVDAFDG